MRITSYKYVDDLYVCSNVFLGGGGRGIKGAGTFPQPFQIYLCVNHQTGRILCFCLGHSGLIPPELGLLSALQQLELQGNALTGVIPKELGGLVNLQYLGLHDNQLLGMCIVLVEDVCTTCVPCESICL